MPQVIFEDLGLIDYKEAWDYQETLFKATVEDKIKIRNGELNPNIKGMKGNISEIGCTRSWAKITKTQNSTMSSPIVRNQIRHATRYILRTLS